MAKPPVSEQVQVNFRMPVDLRDRIKARAEQDDQSMGAAIVEALEKAFPKPNTAMDVVDDVAFTLGFANEKLREEAIGLLVKLAADGRLSSWAAEKALAFKHQDY